MKVYAFIFIPIVTDITAGCTIDYVALRKSPSCLLSIKI